MNAFARHRSDQTLCLSVVADRLTDNGYPAAERGLRDDPATPNLCDDVVLVNDPRPIAHQKFQEVESLRLDVHDSAVATQLATV